MRGGELGGGNKVKEYPNCFGCGSENPYGLRLEFELDYGELRADFRPSQHHEGWPGIVHGGIVSALLYEIMENWPYENGIVTMMRSMDVRLKSPASTRESIRARAWLESRDGRELSVLAELISGDIRIAEGKASLVELSPRQRERLGI